MAANAPHRVSRAAPRDEPVSPGNHFAISGGEAKLAGAQWRGWVGIVTLACGVSLLGLVAWTHPHFHPTAPMLPDYGYVPPFSLTDQQNHSITHQDLQGTVWIAAFFFTRCAGQCPLMSTQMAQLQKALAGTSLDFISFTLDPAYDTPERLRAYARHYGSPSPRWRWITGEDSVLHALAHDGFHLSVAEGDSETEPIIHSTRLVLVDAQGRIRGYYDARDPEAMTRLAADARKLLKAL